MPAAHDSSRKRYREGTFGCLSFLWFSNDAWCLAECGTVVEAKAWWLIRNCCGDCWRRYALNLSYTKPSSRLDGVLVLAFFQVSRRW